MGLESQINTAIQRLSKLSPLEYDQVRKQEAKSLGVRSSVLDAAVRNARKQGDSDDLPFSVVEPWPDTIDPAQLLSDIVAVVRRFIVCEKETAQAASLWVAMTWFIEVVQVAPLAVITAPEKRCGKSLLLFLLGKTLCKGDNSQQHFTGGAVSHHRRLVPYALDRRGRYFHKG